MTPRSEARFDELARRLAALIASYTLLFQLEWGDDTLKARDETLDVFVATLKECL